MTRELIKKAAVFAVVLSFAVSLAGCSWPTLPSWRTGETGTETETAEPSGAETEREPVIVHTHDPDNELRARVWLEEAPGGDLDGADVFFTGPSVGALSPDGASYISKEIKKRNDAVEAKLNVKLNFAEADAASMYADAAASVASGMYYTDVMLLPISSVGQFYSGGCLFNLSSLPFFDLSKPYFNQRSVKALSPGNYCLGFASDAYPLLRETPALFYNRAAEGDDPGALERAAKDGTLTWDLVLAAAETGALLLGEDAYAVSVGNPTATFPQTVFISETGRIITTTPSVPAVGYVPEWLWATASVVGRISASAPATDEGAELFKNGKVAYRIEYVKNAVAMNGEAEFGVVPLPKATAESDYRALVSPYCPVFTVIAGTKNSAEISLVLSSLSAASYGVIPEHYVDETIVSSMRDDKSGDMLDLISKTADFDLSAAFSGSSSAVSAAFNYIGQASSGSGGSFEDVAAAANEWLAETFG
ncbi:MAG: hypothetical protein IJS78_05795 [Clostridia bacterium]|nr:hypothetical protein [Clostridia bacterium]